MPQRVSFYIDGFNFYHGLKSKIRSEPTWKRYYWIDFVALCREFLGADQVLEKVKYFTALPPVFQTDSAVERERSRQRQIRQGRLFKANRLLNPNDLEIVMGKYYRIPTYCTSCRTRFQRLEEKRTDVSIAINMISDCARDLTDVLVLISADSDMVPTVEHIQEHFDKKVRVYFPPDRSSADLLHISSRRVVYLANNLYRLEQSVMPQTVTVGPTSVTCPTRWRM